MRRPLCVKVTASGKLRAFMGLPVQPIGGAMPADCNAVAPDQANLKRHKFLLLSPMDLL